MQKSTNKLVCDTQYLSRDDREIYVFKSGFVNGLKLEESRFFYNMYHEFIDNIIDYDKYRDYYEMIMVMMRRIVSKLFPNDEKVNLKIYAICRFKFQLYDYITHTMNIYLDNINFFSKFEYLDGQIELISLCVKDYINKLIVNIDKSDDDRYNRDSKINNIIN